jgi:hypothetical protein
MHHDRGIKQEVLAQTYRMSKGYIGAKLRAYKLMDKFVNNARAQGKEVKDLSNRWSWFEEFYKKCKPAAPGKPQDPKRVYDGEELESKFVEWMLDDKLPKAEDVRRLHDCLDDKSAIHDLEKAGGDIDKAYKRVSATRPELTSKVWKQIEDLTEILNQMPLSEVTALRGGDQYKSERFKALAAALQRVQTEIKAV